MDTYMLTTTDNPFNPFTQYKEWLAFDVDSGYNTNAYLARITVSSDSLSDAEEDLAIDAAMDEIVKMNITGNYIKVDSSFVPRAIESMKS